MTINERYSLTENTDRPQLPGVTAKLKALQTTIDPALTSIKIPVVMDLLRQVMHISNHLEDAANQVLDGEDPSESMAKYAADVHIQGLSNEIHRQSRLRQIDALNAAADDIIQTIRAEVFEPVIERLRELSEDHNGGWDLSSAINAKDFAGAAVIDEAIQLVARLRTADEARRLLHPGAFDGPAAYGLAPDASLAGEGTLPWWIYLVGTGDDLTFPTVSEWYRLHYSEAHREHREAAAAEVEANKPEPITHMSILSH